VATNYSRESSKEFINCGRELYTFGGEKQRRYSVFVRFAVRPRFTLFEKSNTNSERSERTNNEQRF